jgi:hypothetical protein
MSNYTDDFNGFMSAFNANIREVTKKTVSLMGDEFVHNGDYSGHPCWMLTFNLTFMLTQGFHSYNEPKSDSVDDPLKIIRDALYDNALVIVGQDIDIGHDHWFGIIGENGQAHMIENTATETNVVVSMMIDHMIIFLQNIADGVELSNYLKSDNETLLRVGLIPDATHTFDVVMTYDRYVMNEETVFRFISA